MPPRGGSRGEARRRALDQAYHRDRHARPQLLERDLPPIAEADAVMEGAAFEANESDLFLSGHAMGRPDILRDVLEAELGIALDADRRRAAGGHGQADGATRETGSDVFLAFPGGLSSVDFKGIIAHVASS